MVSTNDEVISEPQVVDAQNAVVPADLKAISEEDFEKAQKTFQLGKKNLFLNKIDESVNNIGDACNVYTAKFGEFDPQCAEIYYFYGRALLELARVESTVLGNALNGVPEESGPIDDSRYGNPDDVAAEEKEEISEKVIDALCSTTDEKPAEENGETTTPAAATTETPAASTTTTTPAVEASADAATAEKPATDDTVEKKEEPAAEGGEGEEEGDEEGDEECEEGEEDISKNDEQAKDDAEAEEISSLQRAWEMFELAKLVYTKNFDSDAVFKNKRIAECLIKLGEISIEQEIYDQAINDISESIRLQEEQKEERDERMLAESYYQLGLAQQFNNLFAEANESYQKSINIVQLRIEKLKAKLAQLEQENENESERNTIKDEINEMNDLLPEMTSKLEECSEQSQQSMKLIKEAIINNVSEEVSSSNGTVTNGEVKDITGLVKSKRKITEANAEEENSSQKKTRLSEANDDKPVNEVTENGNANVEMTTETKE